MQLTYRVAQKTDTDHCATTSPNVDWFLKIFSVRLSSEFATKSSLNVSLIELRFYVPLNTKQVISETFPEPISRLGMKKLNLTQQKHAFTNQNKCTTTQNKQKETKARFSRLLRHPAWKRTWPILISVLHKFVTYFLL